MAFFPKIMKIAKRLESGGTAPSPRRCEVQTSSIKPYKGIQVGNFFARDFLKKFWQV